MKNSQWLTPDEDDEEVSYCVDSGEESQYGES